MGSDAFGGSGVYSEGCLVLVRGQFTSVQQPVKRFRCPFQEGVMVTPFCDSEKCAYGLWCGVHQRCVFRCLGDNCREHGNGVLNSDSVNTRSA